MREAILAVSFGTTVDQARSRDLEGVEQALSAAAPELPLFRAYTSGLVRARLGDRGIALRAGLHCAPLAHQTVGTLETGTVRASVSAFNTEGEIQQVAWVLRRLLG